MRRVGRRGRLARAHAAPDLHAVRGVCAATAAAPTAATTTAPTATPAPLLSYDDDDCHYLNSPTPPSLRYLGALLRTPDAKTAELNELRSLRGILSLDEEAVGDAHYEAGLALFNEQIQWASAEELEDPEGIERHTLDKLLFLSDRIFADANNDESYVERRCCGCCCATTTLLLGCATAAPATSALLQTCYHYSYTATTH